MTAGLIAYYFLLGLSVGLVAGVVLIELTLIALKGKKAAIYLKEFFTPNRSEYRMSQQALKIAKHILTFGPDYYPKIKHGWVRKFVATKKRLERELTPISKTKKRRKA